MAVSENEVLLARLVATFSGHADIEALASAETAHAALLTRPVPGVLVDADLRDRMAGVLTRAFLQHQPAGRIVVVASRDNPVTLMQLAMKDRRVDVVFDPWRDEVLVACLLQPPVKAEARTGWLAAAGDLTRR